MYQYNNNCNNDNNNKKCKRSKEDYSSWLLIGWFLLEKKVILLEYGNMMIEYGKTFPTFLQSKCPLD